MTLEVIDLLANEWFQLLVQHKKTLQYNVVDSGHKAGWLVRFYPQNS